MQDDTCTMMDRSTDHDKNLDMMLSIMKEQEKLKLDVIPHLLKMFKKG